MNDSKLRQLEREGNAGNAISRWRWRCELVRLGRESEAGLRVGDRVGVQEETGNNWSDVPWAGILMQDTGSLWCVKPDLPADEFTWGKNRSMSGGYLDGNFHHPACDHPYLTAVYKRGDKITLLEPVMPAECGAVLP